MNIKLFYKVLWYIHHDRLEAKDNLKAEVKVMVGGRMELGEQSVERGCKELCFRVLGGTKLF